MASKLLGASFLIWSPPEPDVMTSPVSVLAVSGMIRGNCDLLRYGDVKYIVAGQLQPQWTHFSGSGVENIKGHDAGLRVLILISLEKFYKLSKNIIV